MSIKYNQHAITSFKVNNKYKIMCYHGGNLLIDNNNYIDLLYLAKVNDKLYSVLYSMKDNKFIEYFRNFDDLVYEEKDISYYRHIEHNDIIYNRIFNIGYTIFIHHNLLLLFMNMFDIPLKKGYIDWLNSLNMEEDIKEINNKNKDVDNIVANKLRQQIKKVKITHKLIFLFYIFFQILMLVGYILYFIN